MVGDTLSFAVHVDHLALHSFPTRRSSDLGLSLSRLDAVLVTHLHGDHFNGLPGLLGTLGLEGRERPLVVAGPPGTAALLQYLAQAGSLGTGDMEVRVFEQQDSGGEVRIDGSPFLVESRPLSHRVP